MGRYPQTKEQALSMFAKKLDSEPLGWKTKSFYNETIHAVLQIHEQSGIEILPHKITEHDGYKLLDRMAAMNLAIATRKGYVSALKKYTCLFGNPLKINVRWPTDSRPQVDWLSPDQAKALLSADKTHIQAIVIHCELELGMRRVEVVRLKSKDIYFEEGFLQVVGKGPQGGKPRLIPFATRSESVFRSWLKHRAEMVAAAYARYPISTVDPPQMIIWSRGGKLHAYSEEGYGIDKVVSDPLSAKLGFHFSNHTLRRTFGRAMFRAGVPTETIAKILGHDSTEVTLRYIGVDMDDMRSAMGVNIYG